MGSEMCIRDRFITEQNDTLYGIGFKSDIELNNWEIMQPTGVFHEGSIEQ